MEICCMDGCGRWSEQSKWEVVIFNDQVGITCPECGDWYSTRVNEMPVRCE